MTLCDLPSLPLEDRMVDVHARINCSYADLFDLIVEFERRDAYRVDGARSMADWLGYRFGFSEHSSRELCRIARSLEFLPAIADAFRDGFLTFDKVRWLTEFCTPSEDESWARDAVGLSAHQVRAFAIHRRRLAREAADARFKRRYLRIVPDAEEGVVRLWGRLSDSEGMLVKRAIDRAAEHQPADPETGALVAFEQRRADDLVELASLSLGADRDTDRATVVCHVDAAVLASEDGVATIEGEMPVGAETVRRLLCDGRLQALVHAADGQPIGVGRVTRVVPHYLRRVLVERDGGCVWPGCACAHWLHAHHVIHVAHGGRTDEDNLVMLCPTHHRLVHEGGWRMRGEPSALRIVRPNGGELHSRAPKPARVAVGARGP
ncbi:MAG TPA: DUF222 domain-containing protein [Actinomycetota bacterium]|nr:DUF222 domain-containing protein [Actinomycetota bacterium]